MNTQYKAIATVILMALASFAGMAQQDTTKLKKEVEVVKAYQPTIQEFQKINDILQLKKVIYLFLYTKKRKRESL